MPGLTSLLLTIWLSSGQNKVISTAKLSFLLCENHVKYHLFPNRITQCNSLMSTTVKVCSLFVLFTKNSKT